MSSAWSMVKSLISDEAAAAGYRHVPAINTPTVINVDMVTGLPTLTAKIANGAMVSTPVGGSLGTYPTLTALQVAYPNGASGKTAVVPDVYGNQVVYTYTSLNGVLGWYPSNILQRTYSGSAPVISATPATITLSQTGVYASTISGAVLYMYNSGCFEYYGDCHLYPGDWNIFGNWYTTNFNSARKAAGGYSGIAFMTDAPVMEWVTYGNGYATPFGVLIDGQIAAASELTIAATGTFYTYKIDMGAVPSKARLIEIIYWNQPHGGVYVGPGYTLWAPQASVRGIVLGDSYTMHYTGTSYAKSFVYQLGRQLGIRNMWASGVGGTGYLNPNTNNLKLRDRLPTDLYGYGNFGFIAIAMGINDKNLAGNTAAATGAEAMTTLLQIRANYPTADIRVFSPWQPRYGAYNAAMSANDQAYFNAIGNAAAAAGASYIDTHNWLTGLGNTSAPTGSGNSDFYVGPDGTHPPDVGYTYIGARAGLAIR